MFNFIQEMRKRLIPKLWVMRVGAAVLRDYLSAARTTSAKALAEKAVVLINPEWLAGKVAWPEASSSR